MSQENLKNISAFSDLEVLKLGNNAHINDEALAFLLAQLPKLNHLEITATVPAIPQTWHAFQRLNPNPTAEAIKKWEDRYEIINEYNPEGARKLREDTTYPEPTAPFGPAAFNSLRLPELENITFQFLDIGTDLIKKIIETCPNLKIIKLISCPPLPAQIIDIHDSEESRPKVMEIKPWR